MAFNPLNILFVASEVEGFIKTGGLADVSRALPEELTKIGHKLCVCLPYYHSIDQSYKTQPFCSFLFKLNHCDVYQCNAYKVSLNSIDFYLLDHEFFHRQGAYDDGYNAYEDNNLRFAYLSKASLELAKKINFKPDIVHVNDWQTALTPFYMKEHYRFDAFFSQSKSILTIHNGAYQGKSDTRWLYACGIHEQFFNSNQFEDYGDFNMLKGGIAFADCVNSVSVGYAEELTQLHSSHGLAYYFNLKGDAFCGITNGCDYSVWSPEQDTLISDTFSATNLQGKQNCKAALQAELGLKIDDRIPLYTNISRLTDQKGHHFLIPALREFLLHDVQVVILGSGDPILAAQLSQLQQQFPEKMSFTNGYSEQLSHQIEAAGDFFMMPSVFEPCGLNQMYSMRYGTLPIVRATGGLRDTVIPYNDQQQNWAHATGFAFEQIDSFNCLDALMHSLRIYFDFPDIFLTLQQNAMAVRYTWPEACKSYEQLYKGG